MLVRYHSVHHLRSTMTVASRLDLRLNTRDKARIAAAAELGGVSVSTCVRNAALHAAGDVIASEGTVTLSAEETRHLLAALEKPFKPSQRLRQALRQQRSVKLDANATQAEKGSLTARLRGRAGKRMSTDEIMQLTRGA